MIAQEETIERAAQPARYAISEAAAEELGRNLPLLAYSRLPYARKQGMEMEEVIAADWRDFMEDIADGCSEDPDYLLPDTPMKEAIFRFLLARRNKPATAEEISEDLSEKWRTTQFQRDTSPRVIKRLLDSARDYYCIAAVEE